jgi:hypothetical protein
MGPVFPWAAAHKQAKIVSVWFEISDLKQVAGRN